MSKVIKPVTVTKINNSKLGVEDFKFINASGTHCNVYVESIQQTTNINLTTGGTYLQNVKRGCFIGGTVEDMAYFKEGQVLGGKIVMLRSPVPFYDGQNPAINPSSGEVLLHNGQTYYIKFVYDSTGQMEDMWVNLEAETNNSEVVDETAGAQLF